MELPFEWDIWDVNFVGNNIYFSSIIDFVSIKTIWEVDIHRRLDDNIQLAISEIDIQLWSQSDFWNRNFVEEIICDILEL